MRALLASLGLASAGCLLLGSILDWSGVAYSSTLDRRIVAACGVALVLLSAAALVWRRRLLAFALAPAVVSLNMGVVNYRDIDGHEFEFERYPEATVGVGVYLVLVGAVLALAVGGASVLPPRWLPGVKTGPVDP